MSEAQGSRRIRVDADVALPMLPNFLKYAGGTIDVADVTADDLRAIGKAWTEALVEHARMRRLARSTA